MRDQITELGRLRDADAEDMRTWADEQTAKAVALVTAAENREAQTSAELDAALDALRGMCDAYMKGKGKQKDAEDKALDILKRNGR